MAKKKEDKLLNEIDAFLEEEKNSKRKKSSKKELNKNGEKEENTKSKNFGRNKKQEILTEEKNNNNGLDESEVKRSDVPIEEDDLYLTKSFKPVEKKKRLKKSFLKFLKRLFIFLIISLIGWILGIKVYGIYLNTKPINIYKNSIIEISNKINGFLNFLPLKNNANLEIQVETNMKSYDYLNDINFGYGYFSNNELYEDYVYYLDSDNEKHGIYTLIKGNKVYKKYDLNDDIYTVNIENSVIKDHIKSIAVKESVVKNIIKGNAKVFTNVLKSNDIKVSSEELDINGEVVKVKCNTITLNEDFINRYLDELFSDESLVGDMSILFNKNNDELKKYLHNKLNSYVNKIDFNLYVTEKYQVVGFDYELDGFREMYFYKYKDMYDVNVNLNKYINKIFEIFDINFDDKSNLGIDVSNDNVDVLLNNNIKFNLVINEFSNELISFNGKNVSDDLFIDVKIKKDHIIINYKNKVNKYINLDVQLNDYKMIFNSIQLDNVINSSKKVNVLNEEFKKSANKDQLKVYNLLNDIIYDN